MSDRIRLTISVSPEAHAAFSRMAEASGMSLGRCMGEWLDDTIEGVEFVTGKLREARDAPVRVIRELQAYSRGALGALDEVSEQAITEIRERRRGLTDGSRSGGGEAAAAPSPRPVIRGVKSPGKTRGGRE